MYQVTANQRWDIFSASTPYWCCPLLSCFEYINLWTCLGMSYAGPFSASKLPLPTWDLYPHLIHGLSGPRKSTSQTASRLVQPFLNSSHRVPILYNGPPSFPLKNCPFTRGSGSLFNTWFLWPTQVLIPNSILIVIINYYFTHIMVKMLVVGEVIVILL